MQLRQAEPFSATCLTVGAPWPVPVIMQVSGNVTFIGNVAQQGGAIAFLALGTSLSRQQYWSSYPRDPDSYAGIKDSSIGPSGMVQLSGAGVRLLSNAVRGTEGSAPRLWYSVVGGALFASRIRGRLEISNGAVLANNSASGAGGAVYVEDMAGASAFLASGANFVGNSARTGGAISVQRVASGAPNAGAPERHLLSAAASRLAPVPRTAGRHALNKEARKEPGPSIGHSANAPAASFAANASTVTAAVIDRKPADTLRAPGTGAKRILQEDVGMPALTLAGCLLLGNSAWGGSGGAVEVAMQEPSQVEEAPRPAVERSQRSLQVSDAHTRMSMCTPCCRRAVLGSMPKMQIWVANGHV